ncbi:uncharacterized protein LOC108477698 [Gossypium arboreum]|uniref:uncharacterized protein LOC108477698 n=1 Tax=Gossypium arboreum TaxID=29729 RepID=UPI000819598B|nr:uncharacterized protein LOC108477698 [Gossypium arboreum]
MCKHFEEGLDEDVKLLIGILEIREFAVLADRAKNDEELSNEKKQAESTARVLCKRFMGKTYSSPTKKSRSHQERFNSLVGYLGKTRTSKRPNSRSSYPMTTSVRSVGNQKPWCNSCNKFHFGECQMRSRACYRYGSLDHFLKDFPERDDKEVKPNPKSNGPISRGRLPRCPESTNGGCSVAKNSTVKSEAQAPARTYAIHAREETSAPDVITGYILSL